MKRLSRYELSDESEDLDKTISLSTEAILLPFDTPVDLGSYFIEALFYLAKALLRWRELKQPGDLKHSIKYLRYLQGQSLETSNVKRSGIKTFLVWALAVQVEDPMRDIGEMATLCLELLSSGVSESVLIHPVKTLASAIYMTRMLFGQPPPDGAIECLREARIRLPDLKQARFALVLSLLAQFPGTRSNDDYVETMSILDEMISDPNENREHALGLAGSFAWGRFMLDSKPEHLEEAVFRNRALLNAISSEHPNRCSILARLAELEKSRFEAFGVGTDSHLAACPLRAKSNLVKFPLPMPDKRYLQPHIQSLISILDITDPTNIEKAIEYCRLCLTSPHSHLPYILITFGHLLYRLFHLTGNIDYLHESIAVLRDLIKMSGVPINLHTIARQLIDCLLSRFELFKNRRDIDEVIELLAIAVTDTSTDISRRFRTSCA